MRGGVNKQRSGVDRQQLHPRSINLVSSPCPVLISIHLYIHGKMVNKQSTGSAFHLHFKSHRAKQQPFSKMQNCHPYPHLLIVIKFSLIFSFSHLSSPSVWCNSSLSHSLPHHPSLSLGSSEPLTSDPQAGSPAGQQPGGGRHGERRGVRSVTEGCQLPPLAMDTAFTTAAIATGRDSREQTAVRE